MVELEKEFGDEESLDRAKRGLATAKAMAAPPMMDVPGLRKALQGAPSYTGLTQVLGHIALESARQQQQAALSMGQMEYLRNSTSTERAQWMQQQLAAQQSNPADPNNPFLQMLRGTLGKPY